MRPSRYDGVFVEGEDLYTVNSTPGGAVYGEALLRVEGREYRRWNPRRSKLAALLQLGFPEYPFRKESRVLYLGAGTGTTISHIADIVRRGTVYGVEVAPKAFQKLLRLAEGRKNLVPLLGDARKPAGYRPLLEPVDVLYQDVAQRDQAAIFLKNASFLRPQGVGLLMVKARSVDAAARPEGVYRQAQQTLRKAGLRVDALRRLEPYQRDHAALFVGGPRPVQ